MPKGYTVTYSEDPTHTWTITNKYTPKETSVNVKKVWDDGDNRDKIRPESVSVQLLADSEPHGAAVTLNNANGWAHTWSKLPKYKGGKEIKYTVQEPTLPEGYTVNTKKESNGTWTITNTHKPEKTSVTVIKNWADNNNKYEVRPENVTVQLYANGTPQGKTEILSEANDWTHTWTDLYKKENGTDIKYTVKETKIGNATVNGDVGTNTYKVTYATKGDTTTITNTLVTRSLTVKKTWDDDNNRDGIRPGSVSVQLLADGKKIGDPVELKGDGWTYTWTGLPKYNKNNAEIKYTVQEENPPEGYSASPKEESGGNWTITNKHIPEKISITVKKTWVDDNNRYKTRPENVTVQLYANDKPQNPAVTLSEKNGWTYTWKNLFKKEAGEDINYTVKETKIGDVTVNEEVGTNAYKVTYNKEGNTTTITNTLKTKDLKVKKVWEDSNNALQVRPDVIKVRVYGKTGDNKVVYKRDIWLYETNNWEFTIKGLPEYIGDQKVTYSIVELSDLESKRQELQVNDRYDNYYKVKSYASNNENTELTVTNEIESTLLKVTKVWNDGDNQDGKRPTSIVINLYADNVSDIGYTVTLTAGDDGIWQDNELTYTWTGLPKYKNGVEIEYKVRELDKNGRPIDEGKLYDYKYTVNYTGDMTSGYTVTNTYNTKQIEIEGTKTWVDNDNKNGTRPSQIKVHLTGTVEGETEPVVTRDTTVTPDSSGNWTYKFTDLPKYHNGKEISYSVTEDTVPGYTTSVNGYNITNTLEVTSLTVVKKWKDGGNQDGIKPNDVTVKLTGTVQKGDQTNTVKEETLTLSSANNWTHTWENLPKKDKEGNTITYNVEEVKIGDEEVVNNEANGYRVSYKYTSENTIEITNSHDTKKISKMVTKIWKDEEYQDQRPQSIQVQLKKNGVNEGGPVTLNKDNAWSYTWEDLEEYENGFEVRYTVVELGPNGEEISSGQLYNDYYRTTYSEDTFTITNTLQITSVSGVKTWFDSNDNDGARPDEITVQLKGTVNGETVVTQTTTTNAANGWRYEFKNLKKYENGVEIEYSIEEVNVPTGYVPTYNRNNIINVYNSITTEVSVEKIWEDGDDQDGFRPTSVDVRLYANDEIYIERQTIYARNGWKHTFKNLPVKEKGEPIEYRIVELDENGAEIKEGGRFNEAYTQVTYSEDGLKVTNKHVPEVTSKSVKKVWEDNGNQDGKQATSVKVQLIKTIGGKSEPYSNEIVTLDEEHGWSHTWENLPVREHGVRITYSVQEVEVPDGYRVSYSHENFNDVDEIIITNTYNPSLIDIEGEKTWVNDNEKVRPGKIEVQLYANGKPAKPEQIKTVTPDEEGNWKYKFEGLPEFENGEKIEYTVKEKLKDKYLEENAEELGYRVNYDGYNIKNTYITGETSITVIKKWDDEGNQDNVRPENIQVELVVEDDVQLDSSIEKTVTLSEENEWKHTWDKLPKNVNGKEVTYSVKEVEVPEGYEVSYSNEGNVYTITNKHKPGVTSKTVTKVWEDNSDQDGFRPGEVKVQLKKNGQNEGNVETLNEANGWTHTWENLPLKEAGNEIEYTVEEVDVPEHYEVSYSEDKFTITNKHTPETVDKVVEKKWDDENNKDGLRPGEIEVQLYANGNPVEGQKVTLRDPDWRYEFTGLPKYANKKLIKYTVRELKATPGYSVSYENEKDDKFVINNKHVPGTVSVEGEKTWDDNNNQDGKRPGSITVKLTGTTSKGYSKEYEVTVEPDENGNWKYQFANLPEYADGEKITYTISENEVDGYTAEIDKYNIKNTHVPSTIEKTVTKIWDDDEDAAKLRPTQIQVQLMNGDKPVGDVVTLSAGEDGVWSEEELTYTWHDLPEYENGIPIVYTVKEINSPENYLTTYSDDTFTITNTYHKPDPEKTSITVQKVWDDNDDAEGLRPEGIKYNLYADGELLDTVTVTQEDNWTHTFADLQKHNEDGKEIVYTVTEDPVPNYTTTVSEYNEEINGYIITNKYEPKPPDKSLDLSLRKFIAEVNGEPIQISRAPNVNIDSLKDKSSTTAMYNHRKDPVAVTKGDIVTYTIRVYNEGEVNAYVSEITDHLPSNLLPIIAGVEGIDEVKYAKEIEFNGNYLWTIENSKTVSTQITAKDSSYSTLVNSDRASTMLEAFFKEDGTTRDTLDYIDVQIKCLVTDKVDSGEVLTNIAQITGMTDEEGNNIITDADSTVDNVRNVYYDDANLPSYKGAEDNPEELSNSEYYYKGQEDDDDFEKLVLKVFDLSLKKYISSVNNVEYDRVPKPNIVNKVVTYEEPTDSVEVETNDIITYTIRVYNEGDISGYAKEIVDDIPEGLEFLPQNETNIEYKWKMIDSDGNVTDDITKAEKISTNYLSKEEEEREGENLIKYFDGTIFSYKDVKVAFKVIQKASSEKTIINTAEIAEDADENNEPVKDIDSTPNNNEKGEDDMDSEEVKLVYFDIALRKFITQVNDMAVNNRVPEVSMGEDGKIVYTHPKTPLEVLTNDIVVYTIRVYNEGILAGYAEEITDDIPNGLEFMPEYLINVQYNWKMIDENGNITTDKTLAKKITTDYLSKENETEERQNLLSKFESVENISYKDVKVAFRVVEPSSSDRIVINTAEISGDKDYRGNEVYDYDSIPGNANEAEDDIDKEYLRVKFFDLSLKKWVSEYSVTYNGKTQTKKTGFSADKEEIIKIDLQDNKLTKTSIQYKYTIQVTNEGEIAGYAEEIKDYIPDGLSFNPRKNPDWKMLEDGSVVTTKLSDKLLQPGESATVEIVLDWVSKSNNTGIITNLAEISIDRNNSGTPDVDSTPNNKVLEEDDINDAKVAVSVKTGQIRIYFLLTTVVISIIGLGAYGIKKYVL